MSILRKLSVASIGSVMLATATTLSTATSPANAISITPTSNGNTLVNSILGSGVTASNITYSGAPNASGTFTDGASSIGINSGIILTSGDANFAVGPNEFDDAGANNSAGGDTDLNGLVGGAATQDASVLQFDFTTQGGDLFFNYAFASDEYNEYANSNFNDVFGFFVDGQNIALIPGTTTPVSINTVNGGNPFGTGANNPQLYNNNDPNDPGPATVDIEYDGFTDVLTAQRLNLSPGTHTIKIAVADVGDGSYDSAVLIQGLSFSNTQTPTAAVPFEFSPGLGILALGACGAMAQLKSKVKKQKLSASAFSND